MLYTPSKRSLFILLALTGLLFSFKKKQTTDPVTIQVKIEWIHQVGQETLVPGKTYTNEAGESFSVSTFKYYISQIGLIGPKSKLGKAGQYFLMNEEKPESKIIETTLVATPALYTDLGILLGVDSMRNVAGAQTGALDPIHGMFWTWNTGYIMAKLEGNSPASTMPGNFFEYHIGGFKGEQDVVKWLNLPFPYPIHLKYNTTLRVKIKVDLLEWFKNPQTLSIAAKPSITSPGPNAKRVALNYYDMFSIVEAKTE